MLAIQNEILLQLTTPAILRRMVWQYVFASDVLWAFSAGALSVICYVTGVVIQQELYRYDGSRNKTNGNNVNLEKKRDWFC